MASPLFIGIVGSRRRNSPKDLKIVVGIVSTIRSRSPDREIVLVSGGCPKGADWFAEYTAKTFGLRIIVHPVILPGDPPVKHRGEFTERAHARNKTIAEESDILFALVHGDRTGGTENTVNHSLSLGKKVFLVDDDGLLYLARGDNVQKEADET